MPAQSLDRLLQVTAFAISMYNTIKRTQKPFKNLQNSTYELVYPEKGLRAIGEKVSSSVPVRWVTSRLCCPASQWLQTISGFSQGGLLVPGLVGPVLP